MNLPPESEKMIRGTIKLLRAIWLFYVRLRNCFRAKLQIKENFKLKR